MKIMKIIWIMLFCCFFLLACSNESTQEETQAKQTSTTPLSFTLDLSDGGVLEVQEAKDNHWHFKNMEERLKLLVFFITSSESCRSVIPHLVDIQENYKNHLEVLGVSLDDPAYSLNEFLESYNINFKVAHSSRNHDFLKALHVDLESVELPYMALYDASGEYVVHYMGAIPQEMLEFDIKRVLAQSGESSDNDQEEMTKDIGNF